MKYRKHRNSAIVAGLMGLSILIRAFPAPASPTMQINSGNSILGDEPGKVRLTMITDIVALNTYITEFMEVNHIPGLAACIVKQGEILWKDSYGKAVIERDIEATNSTLFIGYSIGKPITGVALMQLWENGLFSLDDDINQYLPFSVRNPYHPNVPINFRMLLTHTSSIKDNWGLIFSMTTHGDSPIPLNSFLWNYLVPGGTYYNPGLNFLPSLPSSQFEYCSVDMALVGYLVERITGIPFDQYCQENILDPLGMDNSSWFLADLDTNRIAMPYKWNGQNHLSYAYEGSPIYPAGQLRSSALEFARFLNAFMQNGQIDGGGSILDSATVQMMTSLQIPSLEPHQGLVWRNYVRGERSLWGHSGFSRGGSTEMWFCKEESTGVIILTNIEGVQINLPLVDILFEFAQAYGLPNCGAVNMTPDEYPISVPPGGQFEFSVTINNPHNEPIITDLWGGVYYDYYSLSLWNYSNIFLQPHASITFNRAQSVPWWASPGQYSYFAYAGDRDNEIICDASFFNFQVSGAPREGGITELAQMSALGEFAKNSPSEPVIFEAQPNPFNAITTVKWEIPSAANVSLDIYNITGQRVAAIFEGQQSPGIHSVSWDASRFPSGIYFCKLTSGEKTFIKRMTLLK